MDMQPPREASDGTKVVRIEITGTNLEDKSCDGADWIFLGMGGRASMFLAQT